MTNLIQSVKEEITNLITSACNSAIAKGDLPNIELPDFAVEIPKEKGFGDFATNIAMQGAKAFKQAPRKTAEIILSNLSLENTHFDRVEIAGPGFINFFLNNKFLIDTIKAIDLEKSDYGKIGEGKGEKVMVEFVSANPTGPMHMGNARGGALGDCIAEVLSRAGYDVTREFYINDTGNQVEKFGQSLTARYLQNFLGEENVSFPEDGYHGEDIKELATEFAEIHGDKFVGGPQEELKKLLTEFGLSKNIERIKSDLEKYRIHYDVWFPESSLYADGEIDETIEILKKNGHTYEKDGALWYKSSNPDSEKDEVLVRANGFATYLTPDIAYHRNKFLKRGFDRVINILGADHHGHKARLLDTVSAVGIDSSKLTVILIQLVRLMQDGVPVKMSKRTGKSITLRDLLEETSVDAARFFFNLRQADSHFDFDLDLAVEQSSQNPVYYVQYAHARICSILSSLRDDGIKIKDISEIDLSLLKENEEAELIKTLALLPEEIRMAAKNYDPSRLTHYLIDTATLFHKFYNSCRVKCDDAKLMQARIKLIICTKTVIKNVLDILAVTAPEKM